MTTGTAKGKVNYWQLFGVTLNAHGEPQITWEGLEVSGYLGTGEPDRNVQSWDGRDGYVLVEVWHEEGV